MNRRLWSYVSPILRLTLITLLFGTGIVLSDPNPLLAKTKLQVFVGMGTGNEKAQLPAQEELKKAFERLHPDVEIQYVRVPWPADNRLTTLIVAGTPPDVVMPVGMHGSNLFLEDGVWLDLDPLISRDKLDLSRYFAPTLQATTFRGTRYGMPVGMYIDALFYNKELFENAALPPPPHDYSDPSWTWERFVEYAKRMTKDVNGDGTPEQWGADSIGNHTVIAASFGARWYSSDFRQVDLDSPEMISAWRFLQDLQHRWKVQPTYQQRVALNLGGVGFPTGKFGMLIDFTARARVFTNPPLPFAWDLAAKPRGPAGPKTLLYLDTANIVSSSKNRELAWEWVKFVSRPENLPNLAVFGYGAIPPTTDGALLYVQQAGKTLPNVDLSVFVKGAPYGFAVEYWRPQYLETVKLIDAALGTVLDDQASVESTLRTLNDEVQRLVDQYWAKRK